MYNFGAEYKVHVLLILLNIKKDNTGYSVELDFDDVFRQIEEMNQRRKLSHNDNFIKGLKTNNINKANFITNNSSSSTCGEVRGRGRSRNRGGKNRGGKKGVNEDVNITSETRGRSFAPLPPYNHCGGPHKTLIYWFKYPEFALIDWRKLNGAKIADF